MSGEVKLLPCPFCGGNAEIKHIGTDWYYPTCENDVCPGYTCEDGEIGGTPIDVVGIDAAVALWNKRA